MAARVRQCICRSRCGLARRGRSAPVPLLSPPAGWSICAGTIPLSEILRFYTEDFVPMHAPTLIAYVQRYTSMSLPSDYCIEFVPYDWKIANSQRPR